MWQGAQGSYKGKGFFPGVIWIHFQMGLRYKSHLPGTFGDLQNPSGAREAEGPGWLRSGSAQHGNKSSEIKSLIFGDASSQPRHPYGMTQQQFEGVLVLEKKSRWMFRGKKGIWLLKRALRSLSHLIHKAVLAWGGSLVAFGDPAEHWVAVLLTPQFMLECSWIDSGSRMGKDRQGQVLWSRRERAERSPCSLPNPPWRPCSCSDTPVLSYDVPDLGCFRINGDYKLELADMDGWMDGCRSPHPMQKGAWL